MIPLVPNASPRGFPYENSSWLIRPTRHPQKRIQKKWQFLHNLQNVRRYQLYIFLPLKIPCKHKLQNIVCHMISQYRYCEEDHSPKLIEHGEHDPSFTILTILREEQTSRCYCSGFLPLLLSFDWWHTTCYILPARYSSKRVLECFHRNKVFHRTWITFFNI